MTKFDFSRVDDSAIMGNEMVIPKIDRLDHVVLTVRDLRRTVNFYRDLVGLRPHALSDGRIELRFGMQKLNLHAEEETHRLVAKRAIPGSADLCFVTTSPLNEVVGHVEAGGWEIIEGPVEKIGALGPISSIYLFDPDGNLVEIASYDRMGRRRD